MIDDQLLIDRIRRRQPDGLAIVPGSIPVTSFGDPRSARVASVGINPSVNEFCSSKHGKPLLVPDKKRFVDRETLALGEHDQPTEEQALRVAESCDRYFDVNPYWSWFSPMQTYVMDPLGVSYEARTAVHLDLVQWATDPVWSLITDASVQSRLVDDDLPFLRALIAQGGYDLIVLNGRTVVETFRRFGMFEIEHEELRVLGGTTKTTLLTGTVGGRRALGWTLNVPGQNLKAQKQGLARWLEGKQSG